MSTTTNDETLQTEEMAKMNGLLKEIDDSLPKTKEDVVRAELLELLKINPELEACFANWKLHTKEDGAARPDMAGPKTSTPALFGKWSAFFPCDWKLEPRLLRGKPSSLE